MNLLGLIMLSINDLSAEDIFDSSVNCVVELKAYSESEGTSYGTAEFVSKKGYLITNAHVVTFSKLETINKFDSYFIRFSDGDDYLNVKLISYDINLDLAILKYGGKDHIYKTVKFGDSNKIKTGEEVFAVGNAQNYGLSITAGIISNALINVKYSNVQRKVIQCDLHIENGNSGGVLFDKYGKMIGLTTFRLKDGYGNVVYGVAYSIPINDIKDYLANQGIK